ncbi:hypothetical protein PG996_003617 [Apiospora saccharicola]|uniref:Uncharacterized protein n=1 Tax=Apiospora saccharicola TaxID=335842 RepID=A0ABR1W1R9_9PEZI
MTSARQPSRPVTVKPKELGSLNCAFMQTALLANQWDRLRLMSLEAAYRTEIPAQARQLCWPCINAWTWPFGQISDAYVAASPMYSSDELWPNCLFSLDSRTRPSKRHEADLML